MVSGIGPSAVLQKLGIPIASELQGVGQNIRVPSDLKSEIPMLKRLQDHPYFVTVNRVNVTTAQSLQDPTYLAKATSDYLDDQSGPLTSVGGDLIGGSSGYFSKVLAHFLLQVGRRCRPSTAVSSPKRLGTISPSSQRIGQSSSY